MIGIITFHFPENYGAVLQTYALQHRLRQIGHEVRVIDYRPAYHAGMYGWSGKRLGLNQQNARRLMLRASFERFRQEYLAMTSVVRTPDELRTRLPEMDAIICGSDQIWSPNLANDTAYLLDFARPGVRRIAYAGSFGQPTVPQEYAARFAPLFSQMDALSVREASGRIIIKELCGRDAEVVLDPTMLVTDWDAIAVPPAVRGGYVLTVPLRNNPLLEKTARLVASALGLPVLRLYDFELKFWKYRGRRIYTGPREYVGLFRNATFVVTTSFHATAFAILSECPFLSVALDKTIAMKNTRMTELLSNLALEERFIDTFDEARIRQSVRAAINWKHAKELLDTRRAMSTRYLETALATDSVHA